MSSFTPQQKLKIALWVAVATIAAWLLAMALVDPLLGAVLP